jgi:hypothetical protein
VAERASSTGRLAAGSAMPISVALFDGTARALSAPPLPSGALLGVMATGGFELAGRGGPLGTDGRDGIGSLGTEGRDAVGSLGTDGRDGIGSLGTEGRDGVGLGVLARGAALGARGGELLAGRGGELDGRGGMLLERSTGGLAGCDAVLGAACAGGVTDAATGGFVTGALGAGLAAGFSSSSEPQPSSRSSA